MHFFKSYTLHSRYTLRYNMYRYNGYLAATNFCRIIYLNCSSAEGSVHRVAIKLICWYNNFIDLLLLIFISIKLIKSNKLKFTIFIMLIFMKSELTLFNYHPITSQQCASYYMLAIILRIFFNFLQFCV